MNLRLTLTAAFVLIATGMAAQEKEEIERHDTLARSVVTADKERMPINSTQTGLARLDSKKFNRGYCFMSSPDLIKTLQTLPGVSEGTELMSGLYVHGGIGSDNIFLLDGVPLYQVSHLAGIFSSFNTDLVDKVDFYKSGFPARYGGRMSSVVDVNTRDGSFEKYHGTVAIGLIDGRLQVEGPIWKGRTSFNIGIRRSWLDVVTVPTFAIINYRMNREHEGTENSPDKSTQKYSFRYAFWDTNAKLTHKFSDKNRLTLNFYMGRDALPVKSKYKSTSKSDPEDWNTDNALLDIHWGNTIGSLVWDYDIADNLSIRANAYYTGYTGIAAANQEAENHGKDSFSHEEASQRNVSKVNDAGVKADLLWTPHPSHHIRMGISATTHWFNPSRRTYFMMSDNSEEKPMQKESTEGTRYFATEPSIYAEDEMTLLPWMSLNAGVRYSVWNCSGKTWHNIEPRAAINFTVSPSVNIKASYTHMNQPCHLVASTYLDLPGNMWMPSTPSIRPLHSKQVAGGVYARLPYDLYLNAEGWYKTMDHLLEYAGGTAIFPPIDRWESEFTEGRGVSYGGELEFGWRTAKTDISAAYTLSWSRRNFQDFYMWWYPDRLDNRHKFTLMASHRFTKKLEMYLGWHYHSGNRVTVASQQINEEEKRGGDVSAYYFEDVYDHPNNLKLPDYHRLDLGFNFHRTTKRGNQVVWNLSFYNAYCRMNPFMYGDWEYEKVDKNYKKRVGIAYGLIPIIPSFSYTFKF